MVRLLLVTRQVSSSYYVNPRGSLIHQLGSTVKTITAQEQQTDIDAAWTCLNMKVRQ